MFPRWAERNAIPWFGSTPLSVRAVHVELSRLAAAVERSVDIRWHVQSSRVHLENWIRLYPAEREWISSWHRLVQTTWRTSVVIFSSAKTTVYLGGLCGGVVGPNFFRWDQIYRVGTCWPHAYIKWRWCVIDKQSSQSKSQRLMSGGRHAHYTRSSLVQCQPRQGL